LVMAGSGSGDSAITVLGLFVGSALVHNLDLASSTAETTFSGRVAVIVCIGIIFMIAILNTKGTIASNNL